MSETTYLVAGRRLPAHPAADVFPAGDANALAADIRERGQRVPVVLTADGETVLDGRTRLLACERVGWEPVVEYAPDGSDPVRLAVSLNLARRHLDESQRMKVGARLANLRRGGDAGKPSDTNAQNCALVSQADAAEIVNVSRRGIQMAAAIEDDPVLDEATDDGTLTVGDAYAIRSEPEGRKQAAVEAVKAGKAPTAKKAAATIQRAERIETARRDAAVNLLPPNLHVCDIDDLHQHVGAGSVDAIVTDPPYLKENVRDDLIYAKLGEFAAHALKPGGLMLAILPHAFVAEAIQQATSTAMTWRWLVAYTQPNATQTLHGFKVTVMFKPWGAWTRAGAKPEHYAVDWIDAGFYDAAAREDHEWGQKVDGMAAVVREWVKTPGSVVCDPFCGSGGILVASQEEGHKVIGADIDAAHVETTRRRLAGEV